MSSSLQLPNIERINFFDGERLTAEDLNALDQAQNELRWLHTRLLHGWGIAAGFGVTGKTGRLSVTIAPGMAVDGAGREIILNSPMKLGIPVISSSTEVMYYLTAAYQADSAQPVLEQRDGVCAQGGAARYANGPLIQWQAAAGLVAGLQVILAAVWIRNCKLSRDVSGAPRRMIAPPSTPPVASGQTAAATTIWTLWTSGATVLGFTAQVDTSAAQFSAVPQYVAQLVGENFLASPPGPLLAVAQTSIANPTATGFTFQAALVPATAGVPVNPPVLLGAQGPSILQSLGWQIAWLGVQS
jgi:hypothetical protein